MAKEEDKNMRQQFVNEERIAAGKKESISEILARGSQAKPENVTHVEHEKTRNEEAKTQERPNVDSKVAERKKELEKEKANIEKESKEHEKKKEKEQDKEK
jgi:hypothetical protein